MNINKIKNTGLILFLLFTILSCEKDKVEPSEIKFKLDGVEHIVTGQADRGEIYSNGVFDGEYCLDITHNGGSFTMFLDIWYFEEIEKKYFINALYRSFNPNITVDDIYYRGEDTEVGSIEITDISSDRIKGKFNFDAKNEAFEIVCSHYDLSSCCRYFCFSSSCRFVQSWCCFFSYRASIVFRGP